MIQGLHSDEAFMKEALKQAQYAFEEGEIPVGAVVVCDNKIIARAYNQTERLNDVTAHAEMLAITSAANYLGSKYLTNCKLYVTLEPCTMCAGATFWSQVDEIIFGAHDDKRGYSRLQGQVLHPKAKVTGGIMEKECGNLVTSFFSKLRD
ncbi:MULTISPECIES: nucleoside deaminase [Reichenbachiella]|uniref:tRNA-specific adenosine deaminase n=1 Tax=Reichenbachiella agariperforans TaxID=156994 RepID=A0A1M6LTV4_REIAG|nr:MULTISPECIES: nucleoside deaminase [Reichenbachiella]MBU2914046.1 nucleoside deaminase [Reichenbachiella agariperforans]RJE74048.1 tRNA-specific adenosine deaminase [Reichenbachiella sp. MSK19-1]SHJ74532.1 tRNA(adenine34) deaminase [Reichenbachiella agariperforans]